MFFTIAVSPTYFIHIPLFFYSLLYAQTFVRMMRKTA
jgi:hypothetical protein